MKIIILIGLPASGKSSWAKEYEGKNEGSKHIEFDQCCIVKPKYFSLESAIVGEVSENNIYRELILDFMFYTNENIEIAINSCKYFNVTEVDFHYWIVDRDQCLINDSIRAKRENRKHMCTFSIANRMLEKPQLEYFRDKYKNISFSIQEHEVFKSKEIIEKKQLYTDLGLIHIKDITRLDVEAQ